MLQVGIVGLPNVGKSTLFNALRAAQGKLSKPALVANYPFATIEPNVGIVPVPDKRLDELASITQAEEKLDHLPPIVPATVQFVDIAGLVKGAAEGAGLGNKFLSHIREVDLICEVVRAFPDEHIIREGSTTPEDDIAVINTELILADLQTLQKGAESVKRQAGSKKTAVEKLTAGLNSGKLASEVPLTDEEKEAAKELQLLTAKKFLYAVNANTSTDWSQVDELAKKYPGQVCVIDAKLEADLAEFDDKERAEYLASLGIKDSGVDQLIRLAYNALGLISFLTAGEKEVRAWTITKNMKAPQAAGVIHTDFEKNFIKAEVVSYPTFIENGGWKKSRELGKVRLEGREYTMQDGDVVEFKVGI